MGCFLQNRQCYSQHAEVYLHEAAVSAGEHGVQLLVKLVVKLVAAAAVTLCYRVAHCGPLWTANKQTVTLP